MLPLTPRTPTTYMGMFRLGGRGGIFYTVSYACGSEPGASHTQPLEVGQGEFRSAESMFNLRLPPFEPDAALRAKPFRILPGK